MSLQRSVFTLAKRAGTAASSPTIPRAVSAARPVQRSFTTSTANREGFLSTGYIRIDPDDPYKDPKQMGTTTLPIPSTRDLPHHDPTGLQEWDSYKMKDDGNLPKRVQSIYDPRIKNLHELESAAELVGPGTPPGEVPEDIEQSTGMERLELLGKMEGYDVFDMRPLDSSRYGTLEDPILIRSFGVEQIVGCSGYPADAHETRWFKLTRSRPIKRCERCGNAVRMEYIGPENPPDHYEEGMTRPEVTWADYLKPEYIEEKNEEYAYFTKVPKRLLEGRGKRAYN